MNRCPICWENMTSRNSFCIKNCKHTFHGSCLYKWFRFKDPKGPHMGKCVVKLLEAPCPMCRAVTTIKTSKLRKYPHPTQLQNHKYKSCFPFFCCGTHTIHIET